MASSSAQTNKMAQDFLNKRQLKSS